MKIVFTFIPPEKLREQLETEFPQISFHYGKGPAGAGEELEKAEVIVTYGEDLNEHYIHKAKRLQWIMIMSAGMERMPFEACKKRGIHVTNARGIHKIPMAEFTMGTMFHHVKKFPEIQRNEQLQEWNRKVKVGELAGKHVLILGIGAIGGEIARLSKAFRMEVTGINRSGDHHKEADRTETFENINEFLPSADFIVSVLPSTGETKYLLTEEHFRRMKPAAVFINIGRGDLIREETLLKIMEEKVIAHAYLDVFEKEPLSKGHPFWGMENVTVTPHLSSITEQYLPRSFEIFKQNLSAYGNNTGGFINYIDLKRGY
ncbi:3-phosphoglycerate dehydrogenase [Bacillus sp. FJAT-27225]|uniref:D-2-hydroxyacid dehydrogenase n=1 Tax=Bacillus sp. FJAT-27225 TaxID=1743144 RepID=UPI00080C21AE|nr:D-2-hydroxyacid dehydrogenase [Bacillus sp. FJAT-27225]OCA83343.1 3-phosphoglycerate dehydrogenase [Bacillus sp. FJAT-27225]